MRQQDILGNLKLLTQSNNITGGLDYERLSKIMFKDVLFANSSRSTVPLQVPAFCQRKAPLRPDHLPFALWT